MSTNGLLSDGITTWMRTTFAAMDKTGLDLTTLAWETNSQAIVQDVKALGFNVETVPNRKHDFKRYATAFRTVLDKGRYDIIHVSCNSALATFELLEAKKRVVGMRIAHSHNTMCTHRVADAIMRPVFYRCVTDCFACGRDAGRWLFGKRRFTVIPNGKELDDWAFSFEERMQVRFELGFTNEDVVIGHVGGFNEQKNHVKLLHVFAELRKRSDKYHLVLIGDGVLHDKLEELAQKIGIAGSVSFLGWRSDVARLVNAMDCMLLPSLHEGFPNVVLEWQLSGLPCVMSATVTDDVVITPLVTKVPLTSADALWADAVRCSMARRDRTADSEAARQAAKARGFDIHDDAALLRKLYLEGVTRCR